MSSLTDSVDIRKACSWLPRQLASEWGSGYALNSKCKRKCRKWKSAMRLRERDCLRGAFCRRYLPHYKYTAIVQSKSTIKVRNTLELE